jgi:hypothetical protein
MNDAEKSPSSSRDQSDRPFSPLSDEAWKKVVAELRWQIESGNLRPVREPEETESISGQSKALAP